MQHPNAISKYFFYLTFFTFIITYIIISSIFVWHDNLTTFASDSANYMLMALYMSPWEKASEPVQALWQYQDFPPLFPLILALSGAAHNINLAHILTLFFLILSIPLIYIFTRKCFATHWQSLLITALFLLSPGTWLNILGILSENLYLFISFLIIILFHAQERSNIFTSIIIGLLITLLILTRTIGIAMLFAYIIIGFLMWHKKILSTLKYFTPVYISLTLNIFLKLIHHSSVPTQYIQQLHNINITEQPKALIEAWFTSWQYYWVDTIFIPHLIVSIFGILACIGLILRLKLLKLDAVYVLSYLCILLLWPHPGQAIRFIYPILPFLIVYGLYAIHYYFNYKSQTDSQKPIIITITLLLTIICSTLSYIWNRYHIGQETALHHIQEFYKFPDIKKATYIASIQNTMFNDMEKINSMTNIDDNILYFTPEYIALLANRHSTPLLLKEAENLKYLIYDSTTADYVYISAIHPRRTGKNFNPSKNKEILLNSDTKLLWASKLDKESVSMFFKISD